MSDKVRKSKARAKVASWFYLLSFIVRIPRVCRVSRKRETNKKKQQHSVKIERNEQMKKEVFFCILFAVVVFSCALCQALNVVTLRFFMAPLRRKGDKEEEMCVGRRGKRKRGVEKGGGVLTECLRLDLRVCVF